MLAPLSWIRDFTPADARVDELVAALNQLGLEVESVEEPGRELVGVRVARILDVLPHPDADRLQLADVEVGDGSIRVVCGAPNIAPGMVVPYAGIGARLPGGLTLERRKIRGQVSEGMILSPRELGLTDDHEGILELDSQLELGSDVREHLGLDDVVFDLAITPNRPDAMCIVGVAREIAAYFGQPFSVPEPSVDAAPDVGSDITVTIETPDRCPRYLARVARVALGASPGWMQQRLVKAGMRPISNVVDVTNYVLLERNQPLHAFDLARLAGRGIVVRLAEPGERITTLDDVERALEPTDLLICDGERTPQAIAGIMGGATAEVAADTAEILLESAYFERMGIARTSKRLRLRSESSARFERGTDPEGVDAAAARALELLQRGDVGAAQVAADVVDQRPVDHERPRITLRTSKVNRVLGTALTDVEVIGALEPLEIEIARGGSDRRDDDLTAVPPSFRPDLEREIDLVEEVARRIGFAAIGRTVPKPAEQVGALTTRQRERRLVADALVGAGASEAMPVPLVAPSLLERFGVAAEAVALTNPLRSEESALRTALLPGLVAAAALNASRGQPDVTLFEVGTVFHAPAAGALLPTERERVAAVSTGTVRRAPVESDRPVDAYDAVDLVRIVADSLAVADVELRASDALGWESGASAEVVCEGISVGRVGVVDRATAESVGLSGALVGFEVELELLSAAVRRDRSFVAPSPFPPSTIDLSFVAAEHVPAGGMVATIRHVAGDLLEDVRAFDEFRGDTVGAGRRSLTFALRFRAADRTLTDNEIAELRERCVAAVVAEHGAELRA